MRKRACSTVSEPDGGGQNGSGRFGGARRLAGTVYCGRTLPLPTKRHPRQQRDHLQRPAQIAEIMHFPPRPDLSERAADPGLMHAVRGYSTRDAAALLISLHFQLRILSLAAVFEH